MYLWHKKTPIFYERVQITSYKVNKNIQVARQDVDLPHDNRQRMKSRNKQNNERKRTKNVKCCKNFELGAAILGFLKRNLLTYLPTKRIQGKHVPNTFIGIQSKPI